MANICMVLGLLFVLSSIALFLLLKHGIESYKKGLYDKKTVIVRISGPLVGFVIFFTMILISDIDITFLWRWIFPWFLVGLPFLIVYLLKKSIEGYEKHEDLKIFGRNIGITALVPFITSVSLLFLTEYVFLLLFFLPLLFLLIGLLIIHHLTGSLKESFDQNKNRGEPKSFGINLAILGVALILLTASIYIPVEFIRTPDANQKFILTLEQNRTDEIELILPNLEGDERYFPVEEYELIKGEGEIESHNEGEYVKIVTSSEIFEIKYFEEAEMFSEYQRKWDFQYDKLEEIESKRTLHTMDISYDSDENTTCRLTLRWEDKYIPMISGSIREVEADTCIDNQTQFIEADYKVMEVM